MLSAAQQRAFDDLELEIRCPICLDTMTNPHSLPCSHSFCKDCIYRVLNATGYSMCPNCKAPAWKRQVFRNVTLSNIVSACEKVLVDAEGLKAATAAAAAAAAAASRPSQSQPPPQPVLQPQATPVPSAAAGTHSPPPSIAAVDAASSPPKTLAGGVVQRRVFDASTHDTRPAPPTPSSGAAFDFPSQSPSAGGGAAATAMAAALRTPPPTSRPDRSGRRAGTGRPVGGGSTVARDKRGPTHGRKRGRSAASGATAKPLNPEPTDAVAPPTPACPPSPPAAVALVGSRLSPEERATMVDVASLLNGVVLDAFVPFKVTHVVAGTGEDDPLSCKRTLKTLLGMASGCWIVGPSWLRACQDEARHVPEAAHEIHDDGCAVDGPKRSRELATRSASVLGGHVAYLVPQPEVSVSEWRDIRTLLGVAGARVLVRPPVAKEPIDDAHTAIMCRTCGGWQELQSMALMGVPAAGAGAGAGAGAVDDSGAAAEDAAGARPMCQCATSDVVGALTLGGQGVRRRTLRSRRLRAEADPNGLVTDAFMLAFGDRMDFETSVELQARYGRPLVDVRWVLGCVSAAKVLPHETHMVSNTLIMGFTPTPADT